MGFIAVKCPQCGSDLNLEEGRDFYFCSYCGSKILYEKPASGGVNTDNLVTLGMRALVCANKKEAESFFKQALAIDINHAPATVGMMLISDHYYSLYTSKHASITETEIRLMDDSDIGIFYSRYFCRGDIERLKYIDGAFPSMPVPEDLKKTYLSFDIGKSRELADYITKSSRPADFKKDICLSLILSTKRTEECVYLFDPIITGNVLSPEEIMQQMIGCVKVDAFEKLLQLGLSPYAKITVNESYLTKAERIDYRPREIEIYDYYYNATGSRYMGILSFRSNKNDEGSSIKNAIEYVKLLEKYGHRKKYFK